jgi:Fur family transcriptional regulator, ferric uptake regulator
MERVKRGRGRTGLSLAGKEVKWLGDLCSTMAKPIQPSPCQHVHSSCANTGLIELAIERTKAAGMRRTRALEDVLHILIEAGQPMTLADVAESKHLRSGADRATVYRLLMKLEERGILRRLGLHDRAAYYTMIFPGQHNDYLICTRCGVIQRLDIACPVETLEKEIAQQSGFSGLYHELEFFGVCPGCA